MKIPDQPLSMRIHSSPETGHSYISQDSSTHCYAMKKRLFMLFGVSFAALLIFMLFIKVRSFDNPGRGPGLAIRWEGFYHDYNFRDVGQSMNDCLGSPIFQTGLLTRSAGWFSGWSCNGVGNPDLIFSLNYSPKKEERYFCQGPNGKTIGRYTNPEIKLSDLEFPKNWDNEQLREPACLFIREILQAIELGKKSLVHCDAGRDRTGTISALLVAMAAEKKGQLNSGMLDAIECDYRKTASLDEAKYGRMKRFIQYLQTEGGIHTFLTRRCHLEPDLIANAAARLLLSDTLKADRINTQK